MNMLKNEFNSHLTDDANVGCGGPLNAAMVSGGSLVQAAIAVVSCLYR